MAKTSRTGIIAAARDLMREKGYAGTSMQDIASRVGLLKGSLYSHFGSKDDLIPDVLELTLNEATRQDAEQGDCLRDYTQALDRLIALLGSSHRCIGLHLAYGLGEDHQQRPEVIAFFDALQQHFHRILSSNGLDHEMATAMARDTIIMLEGATLWLVLYRDDDPMRQARASLLDRLEACLDTDLDPAVRDLLDRSMGDWRKAGKAERRLAARVIESEEQLLRARAALTGFVEAESCFRS